MREVTITNKHIAPITLRVAFDNMLADGDQGGVKYTAEDTPWNLKSWATVDGPTEITLNPRQSRKVSVTLQSPPNAAPGGYYGMLRFTPTERSDLPPVAIQGQIATIFLVRVPGPAVEQGSISEFFATQTSGDRAGWLVVGNELMLSTLIKNEGNVHFATEPNFTANAMFGGEALNLREEPQNVFPQAQRRFDADWKEIRTGYYTVKVKANLPGQPNAEKQFKVLIVTPTVALVTLGVLVVLLLWIGNKIRKRRKARRAGSNAKPKA